MYYWLIFFIPALAIAVNLSNLTVKVFSSDNLNAHDRCYTYLDMETIQVHTIGFWRGQRENLLGLLYSLAMIVLGIMAFFLANRWWMALVAIVGGSLFRMTCSLFGKLHYGSFRYFVELIAEPVLIFFAYYFLIAAHNPYL